MNNGIPSKAAVPKAPKISMITLSIRIPSTASNFLINAFKSRGFSGEVGLEDCPDYRKGIPTQPPRPKVAAKSRKVSLKDFKFLLGVGIIPLTYSCYEEATRLLS